MTTSLASSLADIREAARRPDRIAEAETQLMQLIETTPAVELIKSEDVLRSTIESTFLRKRRSRLHQALDRALIGTGAAPARQRTEDRSPATQDAISIFRSELTSELAELADRHLFQWPYYEQFLAQLYDDLVPSALAADMAVNELTSIVRERVAAHSADVFQRRFIHGVDRQQLPAEAALSRISHGLLRFLDTVVSEYRKQLMRLRDAPRFVTIRQVGSSAIAGVLLGMCRSSFGSLSGSNYLLDSWKVWVHNLPFITRHDLELFVASVPPTHDRDRLIKAARPIAAALDEQMKRATPDRVCAVRTCTYSGAFDRLELTLVEPIRGAQQEVKFHCYLSDVGVTAAEIDTAHAKGMELIMLPLSEHLARWAWRHDPPLDRMLIDTSRSDASERLRDLLSFALSAIGGATQEDVPLTFNFARRFPIDKPDIGADFRVRRLSVQRLLEQHHSDAGVRVWCSVRRSGKTTACQDLQAVRGPEVVITETCESTGVATLKDTFFQAVIRALETGAQLSPTFVRDAIRAAADYDIGRSRVVFVLDEYESLFRQLEIRALQDERLRYSVVQPVLNQLVAFAQRNLIILLGLRPDAHFILMDQNQLSPYVRSDQFPLFDFEPNQPDSEFRELVRRVLTDRIQCDDAFLGNLFAETGGHPVLTVNVLTALCDWLIESERPLARLRLSGDDFATFAARHLSVREIGLSREYDTHRKFARQGLSPASRDRTPWLYSVLHVLRHIGQQPDGTMACSVSDVARALQRLGLDKEPGIDAEELVRTGAEANFFKITGRTVKPRIKLYARLTASVVPAARV